MSLTPSQMIALLTKAPPFSLKDYNDNAKEKSLETLAGDKGTLIAFICNHCPYVVHIIDVLAKCANDYAAKGVNTIAINANDINNYPEDSPENMTAFAGTYQMSFPYLFDETQSVAKSYSAACTPDFFLFDKHLQLVYRGRFDDAKPGNTNAVTGRDLSQAVDQLVTTNTVQIDPQMPSIGCNIKWK